MKEIERSLLTESTKEKIKAENYIYWPSFKSNFANFEAGLCGKTFNRSPREANKFHKRLQYIYDLGHSGRYSEKLGQRYLHLIQLESGETRIGFVRPTDKIEEFDKLEKFEITIGARDFFRNFTKSLLELEEERERDEKERSMWKMTPEYYKDVINAIPSIFLPNDKIIIRKEGSDFNIAFIDSKPDNNSK